MSEAAKARQKRYEYNRYHSDLSHHFIKRYKSRIDNFFGEEKHRAEDLLRCDKDFFFKWIKSCLRDSNRASVPPSQIELAHIRPVTSFNEGDLSGWCWMNVYPCLESENLEQKDDRIPSLE